MLWGGASLRSGRIRTYDIGSQALNAADYAALGGRTTNALEKAAMIKSGYEITTTASQRLLQSLKLAHTGLTPSGDLFVGAASTYSAIGRAGNHSK